MARSTLSYTPKVDNTNDVMAEHVNTLQTNQEKIWNTLAFVEATELTIDAAGAIIVTQNYHTVDTLADAASDDLDTITISGNIGEGSILIIRPDHTDRTIVVKHNTGNIMCNGNADITLDDSHDLAILIYDETLVKWMAMYQAGTSRSYYPCQGRLTLETGVAVSTADQINKTDLYFTPHKGNLVSLYSAASGWQDYEFTERSIAVGAFTASKLYDIFVYDNSGTITLSETEWTNGTTRATPLTTQDGVLVKTGATGYRYLGTIYIDAAQKCQDSDTHRYAWNYYNRVLRHMFLSDGTNSWAYAVATWRQSNAATVNRHRFIIGVSEDLIMAEFADMMLVGDGEVGQIGIGLDSITVPTNNRSDYYLSGASGYAAQKVIWRGYPGIGYHYIAALEKAGIGTVDFYGDDHFQLYTSIFG